MRLGISFVFPHSSPAEWAAQYRALGLRAVVFPSGADEPESKIDAYVQAAREHDLTIAEVGAWSNPMSPDADVRAQARRHCRAQLALAERIGARCCVNIAGGCGARWDAGYRENYAADTRAEIIRFVQNLLDEVAPQTACYALEPMPWMVPSSPEDYVRLLDEVGRPQFAVHLDVANMINCAERYIFSAAFIDRCFDLLAGRIRSCHVKDVRLEQTLTQHLREVPCGEGGLDLAHYARRAHQADPDMPFLIEHLETEAQYRAAVAYLQDLCARENIPY